MGVVVVSFDSEEQLPACLAALCGAAGVAAVVVVDNASRDASADIVRSFPDPRVRLLALPVNTGFAGGCNRGFAALPRELPWVAFVNPDVVVSADCLSAATAVADPTVAGVAPRLMRPDGVTVDSVGQLLDRRTLEVRDRGYGQPLHPPLLEPRPVLAACGALAVYRRAALNAVAEGDGPWAGHYFCFWEDLELGWRLTNRGFKVVAEPGAVAVHTRGAGAREGSGPLRWRRAPELEACILSNRWMTLIRHLPLVDALRRAPVLLSWDVAMLMLSGLRRPLLLGHLRRRWRLVYREWRRREHYPRLPLAELPW